MSFRKSLGWVTLGQAAFFLFQFAGSVVLARLLSPYEMGVFALAWAIVGLISVVQSIGLTSFIVRERELDSTVTATAFTVNLLLSLGLAVVIVTAAVAGERLYGDAGVRKALLALAALPLAGAIGFLPSALLERDGDFRALALLRTGSAAVATGLTVTLALLGHSYMSMAYGQVAGAVVGSIAVVVVGKQRLSWRLSLAGWRLVAAFGVHMLLIAGVNSLAARVSELFLGRLLGLAALGIYGRATNIYNLLWDNIHLIANRVIFVDFAHAMQSGEPLRPRYVRALELMTALLWPAFLGLAVLAGPFISLVYGPKWLQAAPVLSLLCLAAVVLVSITMTWEVFVLKGETSRQARLEIWRAATGSLLFIVGSLFSLTAAAAARVGEAVFSWFLYRPHLARLTETSVRQLLPIYLRSFTATLAAVGPSAILMAAHSWSARTPIFYVAVSVGVGIVLWLWALRLLQHPLFGELSSLLSAVRSRFSATEVGT